MVLNCVLHSIRKNTQQVGFVLFLDVNGEKDLKVKIVVFGERHYSQKRKIFIDYLFFMPKQTK